MLRKLKPAVILVLAIPVILSGTALTSQENNGQILGGTLAAPIRLEIFSDFQCPACRDLYLGTIRQVLQEYCSKDKVCVIYHEFLLPQHQYARQAARFSQASARLGQQKMLPVYDSLFSEQAKWSQDGNVEAAVAKALTPEDMQKVKKFMQDPSIDQTIDRELKLGTDNNIKSTPTIFMYYIGRKEKVEGIIPYDTMKNFFDRVVK